MKILRPWTSFEKAPLRSQDRALKVVAEKSFIDLDGFGCGEKIYYLHLQSQGFVPFHALVIDSMVQGRDGLEAEAFLTPTCVFDQGKYLLLEGGMSCENCDHRLPFTSTALWSTSAKNAPGVLFSEREKVASMERILQIAPLLTLETALAIVTLSASLTAQVYAGWPLIFPEESPYALYRREN